MHVFRKLRKRKSPRQQVEIMVFKHRPLGQPESKIRLCRLERPSNTKFGRSSCMTIKISVDHFDLISSSTCSTKSENTGSSTTLPSYKALSYTWGGKQREYIIHVNGRPLVVRQNLYDFLTVMQTNGEYDTWFWIDQLCINQDDIPERNSQVPLMSAIYSGAEEVYTWLGLAANDSDHAFKAFRTFETWSKQARSEEQLPEYSRVIDRRDKQSLLKLLTRPYWSRIWIIQEVYLARTVTLMCGSSRYTFPQMTGEVSENLFRALGPDLVPTEKESEGGEKDNDDDEDGNENRQLTHDRLAGVFRLIRYRFEFLSENNLLDLVVVLHPYHLYDSSDPRDQVFGFQACLMEEQRITVDYNKTLDEIFYDTARALVDMYCKKEEPISEDAPFFLLSVLRRRMGLRPMKTEAMRELIRSLNWPTDWK